jgi:transcriptional regulator with XRE-family HTH domain
MAKRGPHPTEFTPEQEQALVLLFEHRHSYAQVAEMVGVSSRTIERWATDERFKERLEAMRADLAASLAAYTYVSMEDRIIALSQMAEKARVEFEARPWLKEVRPTPKGDITNEAFNEGAFAAFRGALDDIAKELGHRRPKEEDNKPQMRVVFIVPEVAEMPRIAAPVLDSDTWPEVEGGSDGDSST